MKFLLLASLLSLYGCNTNDQPKGATHSNITIFRDSWGVPHVYGKTDADAVFGIMYAQCEESFERVERNYIERLGRLSEILGERYLLHDLQTRLIYDTLDAIKDYQRSPGWLRQLLDAFANGVNYYLEKHPDVKPSLLKRFEPWYPLMFTDGGLTATQTGGADLSDLKSMYAAVGKIPVDHFAELRQKYANDGSNAFAVGPSKSASGKSILYINPHVNFYFRTEGHLVSEQGLNAYGAITWGQFFPFQGFNEHCGWMHTSSLADASDLYEESIVSQDGTFFYRYMDSLRKVTSRDHVFKVMKDGNQEEKTIKAYYTHHGPVIGKRNEKWLALRERNRTMDGLIQSWQRIKARNYEEFKASMNLRANNSCNTMYADKNGTIAYWHGNFMPKRNPGFDYTRPLEGTVPGTEWLSPYDIDSMIHFRNPASGWLQNCNSGPFAATGSVTLNPKNYPVYMAPEGENFRSLRAIGLLRSNEKISIDRIIEIGYDRHLAAFDSLLPPLFKSFDELPGNDSLVALLQEPMKQLKSWNRKADASSVALSLAVEWTYKLLDANFSGLTEEEWSDQVKLLTAVARKNPSRRRLELLRDVLREFEKYFGTWQVPWGEITRFQRLNGEIDLSFDDAKESLPAGLVSATFGCLPAYESVFKKTNRSYGVAGNSFVAAVEFGEKVKAKSIVAGGQSFKSGSKNFNDQAKMFLDGKFKDVNFYKEDVKKNAVREYKP